MAQKIIGRSLLFFFGFCFAAFGIGFLGLFWLCLLTMTFWGMALVGKAETVGDKLVEGLDFLFESSGYFVLFCIPVMVAGIIAPFRGLFMLLIGYDENGITHQWEKLLLFPGREFDLAIGLSGVFFGLLILVFDGIWRMRQSRQVLNLARSKAGSAAIGLAEFQGVARWAEPLSSNSPSGHGIPSDVIIFHQSESVKTGRREYETRHYEGWSRFFLEDGSGRILVDPGGAVIRLPVTDSISRLFYKHTIMALFFLGRRMYEMILSRHVKEEENGTLRYLRDGDPVYLIGNVEIDRSAPPEATGSERLVVRPRSAEASVDNLLRFYFGVFNKKYRRDIHDVFLLADTGEQEARKHIQHGQLFSIGLAILWISLSAWLACGFKQ
ncbi:MAG: hypothetical protein A2X58_13160 [Nitrospirae bacterium GWC2_56_14]|nr:MAG: hypothetical protein A2X58_13160 [Nitrospirae bacterium GWC2_56_14]